MQAGHRGAIGFSQILAVLAQHGVGCDPRALNELAPLQCKGFCIFGLGAEFAQGLDLDRVSNLSDLRAAISAERKRIGPGKWLMGFALEYSAIGGPYHHSLLDDAAGDGPMFLYTLDVHTGMVNAEAMKIANLTGPMRVADNSVVVVDENDNKEVRQGESSSISSSVPSSSPISHFTHAMEGVRQSTGPHFTIHDATGQKYVCRVYAEDELIVRSRIDSVFNPAIDVAIS